MDQMKLHGVWDTQVIPEAFLAMLQLVVVALASHVGDGAI